MKILAYIITDTTDSRPDGKGALLVVPMKNSPTHTGIWIPRSVVPSLSKKGHPLPDGRREAHLTLEDWWVDAANAENKLSQFKEQMAIEEHKAAIKRMDDENFYDSHRRFMGGSYE